jgi:hypothetical protein
MGRSKACLVLRPTYDGNLRSWNIYHLACLSGNSKRAKFIDYLLKTLPEELTHELMVQTSKEAFNTVQNPIV